MDELTACVRTTVDAAVDKVFTSWVSPDSLAVWFWPFPAAFDVDLSVGGAFHYSSAALGVAGRFLEIDAPHRLAFTWIWDGEFDETRVSVEFRSVPDGTEIVLMHTGNADETARDNHAQGWRDCLARLGPSLG
jgi:uncharacterized protein YndB with AHSA1/START domain